MIIRFDVIVQSNMADIPSPPILRTRWVTPRSSGAAISPSSHDLPTEPGQIGEHRAEVPAALEPISGQQPDATVAVGDDGEVVAVMLHLEEPIVDNRRLARRRAELEGDGCDAAGDEGGGAMRASVAARSSRIQWVGGSTDSRAYAVLYSGAPSGSTASSSPVAIRITRPRFGVTARNFAGAMQAIGKRGYGRALDGGAFGVLRPPSEGRAARVSELGFRQPRGCCELRAAMQALSQISRIR